MHQEMKPIYNERERELSHYDFFPSYLINDYKKISEPVSQTSEFKKLNLIDDESYHFTQVNI